MGIEIDALAVNLAEYIGRAASGEQIVITDRDRPVARLVAYVEPAEIEPKIGAARPVQLGDVRRARSDRSSRDVLDDDRG